MQKLLDDLTGQVEKPSVTIFLLDCGKKYYFRNSDLQKLDARDTPSATLALGSFGEMHNSPVSSLTAFACAPGALTNDFNREEENGLFTKHLLKYIGTPKEDIRMILSDVANDVQAESGGKQIPYYCSTLTKRDIYLNDSGSGKHSLK